MGRFAFILCPMDSGLLTGRFPFFRKLPPRMRERLAGWLPSLGLGRVTGITSKAGAETEGVILGCPSGANGDVCPGRRALARKLMRAIRLARQAGATVAGLSRIDLVNSGEVALPEGAGDNTVIAGGEVLSVAFSLDTVKAVARLLRINPGEVNVTIWDATSPLGSGCAMALSERIEYLTLVGRNKIRLNRLASELLKGSGLSAKVCVSHVDISLGQTDVVVVGGDPGASFRPRDLKPGAAVVDLLGTGELSSRILKERNDILVIEGGMFRLPGDVAFEFDMGFLPGMCSAPMAEAVLLAFAGGKIPRFSVGAGDYYAVKAMFEYAELHGIRFAGLNKRGS